MKALYVVGPLGALPLSPIAMLILPAPGLMEVLTPILKAYAFRTLLRSACTNCQKIWALVWNAGVPPKPR